MLRGIIKGIIIGAIALGNVTHAANVSTEIMYGEEKTLDMKVACELAPNYGIFTRNTTSIADKVYNFGLVDLTYKLSKEFDMVVETQFPSNSDQIYRLGIQYFKRKTDFSIYLLSTISDEPDCETVILFQYRPKINEEINLYTSLENLTNIGRNGHKFSKQRLRIGLESIGFQYGIACDIIEIGEEGKLKYNGGFFLRKEFD